MDFSWSIAFGTHGERRQCDKTGRTKACQDLLASRLAIRHSRYMGNDVLTASLADPADFGRSLSKRQLRYFRVQVEDWYDVCRHLSDWEDRHLVDAPSPEHLAEHARLLDELEQVGRWLSLATQSPDFPDRSTAELVAMTLQDLKDARALWHGSMTRERRQEILRAVFNEP